MRIGDIQNAALIDGPPTPLDFPSPADPDLDLLQGESGPLDLSEKALSGNLAAFFEASVPPWLAMTRSWIGPKDYGELIARYRSIVYACASRNATEIAQQTLRLYVAKKSKRPTRTLTRRLEHEEKAQLQEKAHLRKWIANAEDVEEVLEHPFLDLMREVNPYANGFETLELIQLYLELTGNAYVLKVRNTLGVPGELWVLPAQYVRIVPSAQTFIKEYIYDVGTDRKTFPPEDVIHFRMPNPRDQWYGTGPLEATVGAADLHRKMNEYEETLFTNNARPDMLLTSEQKHQKEVANAIVALFKRKFMGHKKAGQVGYLGGGMDIKQLNWSPRELGYLVGRKLMIEEIAMVYGVPLSKLKTEDVNRANAEAGDYTYAKNTVLPRLRRLEQKLNEDPVTEFDEKLFCSFDNPVPKDKEFRLKERAGNLTSGYMSINEERQRDNQEEVPWGVVPIMPMNMMPLGSAPPAAPAAQGEERVGEGKEKASGSSDVEGEVQVKTVPEERTLEGAVKRVFEQMERRALTSMDDRGVHLEDAEWTDRFIEAAYPYLHPVIIEGGERAVAEVRRRVPQKGMLDAFDITNPRVQEFLSRYVFRFSFEVVTRTIVQLRESLRDGIGLGETTRELAGRVRDIFTQKKRYEALRIARTETARAYTSGQIAGYRQTGLVESKEWIAGPGACEFCAPMNGKVIGLTENFYDQGGRAMSADGNRALSLDYSETMAPPLHPNCMCGLAPVLVENV